MSNLMQGIKIIQKDLWDFNEEQQVVAVCDYITNRIPRVWRELVSPNSRTLSSQQNKLNTTSKRGVEVTPVMSTYMFTRDSSLFVQIKDCILRTALRILDSKSKANKIKLKNTFENPEECINLYIVVAYSLAEFYVKTHDSFKHSLALESVVNAKNKYAKEMRELFSNKTLSDSDKLEQFQSKLSDFRRRTFTPEQLERHAQEKAFLQYVNTDSIDVFIYNVVDEIRQELTNEVRLFAPIQM